ncbi:MAG: glucosaminidase domain-containing protein [Sulfurospirillaceae bacterium]|nr:glucosaminidase domain-containing protein [Sulfurospirillaceae bacterium]
MKIVLKPLIASFVLGVFLFSLSCVKAAGFPASYYKIEDIEKQKEEFIKIIKPFVEKNNENIRAERAFVVDFFSKALADAFRGLSYKELGRLIALREKYGIRNLFDKDEFLKKIDEIPVSLALAQSAIESGWGKSRFAREANNLFGHWTFTGKGIIPEEREEGKTHMLRIFSSLQNSVNAYMLNLNKHASYEEFRAERLRARVNNENFGGKQAALTMENYSELRQEYVKKIQKVLSQNNLLYFDTKSKERQN